MTLVFDLILLACFYAVHGLCSGCSGTILSRRGLDRHVAYHSDLVLSDWTGRALSRVCLLLDVLLDMI